MTASEILEQLKSLSNDKVRAHNIKYGAGENQFGVKLGDIRGIAKKLKSQHKLAVELWRTGNVDAMLLSVLLFKPQQLSADELDKMVREATFSQLADWFNAYIVKDHPDKESLRNRWMQDNDPMAARAGWSLTAGRIARNPDGIDIAATLDRIETEMPGAPAPTQWTMNNALANIGIYFPEHRKRALEIGERLGIYRDFPVSKGCTSPFAPIWINEMVKRQG